jgi:hypothetical protein
VVAGMAGRLWGCTSQAIEGTAVASMSASIVRRRGGFWPASVVPCIQCNSAEPAIAAMDVTLNMTLNRRQNDDSEHENGEKSGGC